MNTQPPLMAPPSLRPRLSRNARIAAGALAASIAILVFVSALLLLRGSDDGIAGVPPSTSPTPLPTFDPSGSPPPSASPVVAGSPGPTAAPTPKSQPTPLPIALPVSGSHTGSVLMTPGPDGGVYVAIQGDSPVVLALVGTDGAVRPGWPITIRSRECMQLLTAADGTLRAICDGTPEGEGLQTPMTRIYAYDGAGRSLAGWPVDVEGSIYEYGAPMAAIDGADVTLVVRVYQGDQLPEGVVEPARLFVLGPDGAVASSDEIKLECCGSGVVPGRGIAYVLNRDSFGEGSTQVTAFDVNGERWQTTIDSILSNPSLDRAGNAYFTTWNLETAANRVVTVDPIGRVTESTDDLPNRATGGYSGAGPEYPGAPIVAPDGSFFVVGFDEGLSIMAFDARGRARSGWPVGEGFTIAQQGFCGDGDTGCGTFDVAPRIGPDGTLYVATQPGEVGGGGSLLAIGSSGAELEGWPVGLKRGGASYWNVLVGSDGGVWALAAEPEGTERYSGTLLSIAPDSTVRGRLTITEQ